MTPALALTFALLASLAQIVSILNWLQIGPHKLFNREWWKTREVTVTKGRLAIISMLGLLSLGLSAYGLYVVNRRLPIPTTMQWGFGQGHCTVIVDTSPIIESKDDYNIVLACGIVDPTIDTAEDKRIILSGPFSIYGGPQAISAASNPEFEKLIQPSPLPVSIWQKVFLIPKDRTPTEIHKLSDVPRIKGKLF